MFRSIWFWVIAIGLLLVLWLGRDQLADYFDKLPLQTTPRTTNTKALASATPRPATSSASISASQTGVSPTGVKTGTPAFVAVTPGTPRPTTTTSPKAAVSRVATASPYTIYVVKKGDTLYSIAKRFHTDVPTLQQLNHITDPSKLAVGQKLKVPKPASASHPTPPTAKPGTKTYKVKPGDTLSSIARKFHTSVPALQKLNQLANPNQLAVGSVILVPATTPAQATPSRVPSGHGPTPPAPPGAVDEEVHSMPVLTPSTGSPGTAGTAAPPPTPTPTPIPTMPSICQGNQEAVFVWGVSFCVPPGWTLKEYAEPHRTALMTRTEASGDLSLYAISRLEGFPNAPLSWSMRQARESIDTEIASLVPGGLTPPQEWSVATAFSIGGQEGQMSEGTGIYKKTGHKARVRVVVFNAAGQRWRIVMIAPEELWQGYSVTVFPYIARTLEVF